MRLLLDPEQRRTSFEGKHFRVTDAPNNPKPLQPRIPIWIGGRGEKRTLRAAAKYADGWNGAYIGPDDWKHLSQVLDQWCEKEGRDPKTIMRTVNLGFYLGADAKGAARAEEVFRGHWGGSPDRADRTGYLRGTVPEAGHGGGVPRARLHAAQHRAPRGALRLGGAGGVRRRDRPRMRPKATGCSESPSLD